jgi:hypothetical protein
MYTTFCVFIVSSPSTLFTHWLQYLFDTHPVFLRSNPPSPLQKAKNGESDPDSDDRVLACCGRGRGQFGGGLEEEVVPLPMASRGDELEDGALQFVHHLT